MGELTLAYKLIAGLWTIATMGFGYMLNDLKNKTKRNEDRADKQDDNIKDLSIQVGKLETNTVTKQELADIVNNIQIQLNSIQTTLQKDIQEGLKIMKDELKEDIILPMREDIRLIRTSMNL